MDDDPLDTAAEAHRQARLARMVESAREALQAHERGEVVDALHLEWARQVVRGVRVSDAFFA